ncbi:MAG: sulfite dehydrogenase [Acidobacteriaceae bacterium]|nr:sulfite dehydrogenase [Acidobacteriaceae bacterium]
MADRRSFLGLAAVLTACTKSSKAPSVVEQSMAPYGERAAAETNILRTATERTGSIGVGSSTTPLQELHGVITPSALHFERHHAGIPKIDPAKHTLLVHGLVAQPMEFTLDDLKRLPAVTRTHFIECSGNGGGELRGVAGATVEKSHGLLSCSEWTGVPLKFLLEQAGVKPEAKWVIAEGADACRMARSIPMAKCMEDALVVYGQNGEALRPGQGYPLRLLLPGFEGNSSVKWLDRLHVTEEPAQSNQETAHYTDLLPNGKARQFSFVMDTNSVITRPSGGQKIAGGAGFVEISGIAWTGNGKIKRVEVSTDGGKTWIDAALEEPVLSRSLVRFRAPWVWDGKDAVIQSRATDETGYLQPTRDEIVEARGMNSQYHYHGVKPWVVKADGSVTNV